LTTQLSSRVSERLSGLSPSPTGVIDTRAKALKAAGLPIISFGAGEPDFATPHHVVEAAANACFDPSNHKYTPAAGLADLREAIVAKSKRDTGLSINADQVLVTNGGKHAVATSLMAMVNPGDEVLIPAPYWTSYPEAVYLAGGKAVPVACSEVSRFRVTVDNLERARTAKTKVLVFVSPSNPTGAVVAPNDIADIGRWAAAHDIWVLCDEIYEHLVYGDAINASLPVVTPELDSRWVVVNGVSKSYAMTGWRVGWMIGARDVVDAAIRYQGQSTSNISNVSQRAAVSALTGDQTVIEDMRRAFDRRRQFMTAKLNAIDGVNCVEPDGAFYCFPNVTRLLGRVIGGRAITSSIDLAEVMLESVNVAVVPGDAFGAPGYLRLSYALGDDDLFEGLERFARFISNS
jgi:aspartate/methionine/tyrosine aminotransferase